MRHERVIGRGQRSKEPRPMFIVNRVPGFAAQMRRENSSTPSSIARRSDNSNENSQENGLRPRDNSPKMPRPRSEEIPLEDMRLRKAALTSAALSISNICQEKKDGQISACATNGEPSTVIRKHSEETSFTCPKETKPRKKGQVETV
ncbi:uncharacterized protein LOC144477947 [Augochlora pura]